MADTLIIRYKTAPHGWALLTTLDGQPIEGDIRPDRRRHLEETYHIEVDPAHTAETFEVLKLSLKK